MFSFQCPKCYSLFSWGILVENQWDFCPYCKFDLWRYYQGIFEGMEVREILEGSFR